MSNGDQLSSVRDTARQLPIYNRRFRFSIPVCSLLPLPDRSLVPDSPLDDGHDPVPRSDTDQDFGLAEAGDGSIYPSAEFVGIPSSILTVQSLGLLNLACERNSRLSILPRRLFAQCVSLRSIFIPSRIRVISESCFDNCRALSTVTVARGSCVTVLQALAFGSCESCN